MLKSIDSVHVTHSAVMIAELWVRLLFHDDMQHYAVL